MSLHKVRLELARDHDFPNGSRERGYEFTAPLGDDDRIDHDEWQTHRDRCRVLRFWEGEDDEVGPICTRVGKEGDDLLAVAVEVPDDGIQLCEGESQGFRLTVTNLV